MRVSAEAVAAGVRALVPTNVPFGVLQASLILSHSLSLVLVVALLS